LLVLVVNCLVGRGPAERSLYNPLYSCIRECQLIAVCCRNYIFHKDMQALKIWGNAQHAEQNQCNLSPHASRRTDICLSTSS